VLADQRAVGGEDQVRVEDLGDAARAPLVHAHDHVRARLAGRGADTLRGRPGNVDGVAHELDEEILGRLGTVQVDPVRKARNEHLRQGDQLGARAPRFPDQRADLVDRRGLIEIDGRRLNRRRLERSELERHVSP
jgi:hypothetical protein